MMSTLDVGGATGSGSGPAEQLARVETLLQLVIDDLRQGKHERGAIRFVEELALGPGSWFALREPTRRAIVAAAGVIAGSATTTAAVATSS